MFSVDDALLPLLQLLSDGQAHRTRDLRAAMADQFRLSEDVRRETLPSGSQSRYGNRTQWALVFLVKAGLLEQPHKGYYVITDAGREILARRLDRLSTPFLRDYSEEFREWNGSRRSAKASRAESRDETDRQEVDEAGTPEEVMASAAEDLRERLAEELLEAIARCSPRFFEDLVVRLLVKMGYGGSFEDAAHSVGRSGDGGIDGIIKEDRLGLDVIYVQAKRWQASVGRPQVQAFIGALTGQRARKGVCITTSTFTRDAIEYVRHLDTKVVLIDGETLAKYMIEVGLGVTSVQTFEIKRLDSDFFEG